MVCMATVGERIVGALGGVTKAELEAAVGRAYESGYFDGNDEPPQGGLGVGYKRHMAQTIRDLEGVPHGQVLDTVWKLYLSSPLAKRIVTMKRDHIVGNGVRPTCNDIDLQDILNEVWEREEMERFCSEMGVQLPLFGEQCLTVFVRKSDGRVSIGYIDPVEIEAVVLHPDNARRRVAVVRKLDTATRVYRIVRESEAVQRGNVMREPKHPDKLVTWQQQGEMEAWERDILAQHGRTQYDGDCLYAAFNAMSNQSRGISDLVQVADWIDQADETAFALADREQFAGYFSWDVTLKGADGKKVKQRKKDIGGRPPRKGMVNVHNDSEEWQFVAPDLKQQGSIATWRMLLGLILGGIGYPVHWYGFGDEGNRATATVQADPTTKTLEHDQGIIKQFFLGVCRFVADQAAIAGEWKGEDELTLDVALPPITKKALGDAARLLPSVTQSLISGGEAELLSHETAQRAYQRAMGEFGVDYDLEEERERIKGEKRGRELEDGFVVNETIENLFLGVRGD